MYFYCASVFMGERRSEHSHSTLLLPGILSCLSLTKQKPYSCSLHDYLLELKVVQAGNEVSTQVSEGETGESCHVHSGSFKVLYSLLPSPLTPPGLL